MRTSLVVIVHAKIVVVVAILSVILIITRIERRARRRGHQLKLKTTFEMLHDVAKT